MKKYAFISRHVPTDEQVAMAAKEGIEIVHIGDLDAFHVMPDTIKRIGFFHGVIVVHPAMALNLIRSYSVGVFENAMRAMEGEKPTFLPSRLHIFDKIN